MKTKTIKLTKTVWVIILAALVVLACMVPMTAVNAEGGSMTVGVSDADLGEGTVFTFRMYRIGGFDGPVFAKEDPFTESKADVSMPKPEAFDGTEEEWTQKWADAADTLKADIESGTLGDRDEIATDVDGGKTFTISSGGNRALALPADGLYLLVGEPVLAEGMTWTPAPTFIGMLDGAPLNTGAVNIKLSSKSVSYDHKVVKTWARPEGEEASAIDAEVRPSEVKVRISYGGNVIDTVTLDEDSNWTYQWKSLEDEDSGFVYIKLDSDGNEVSREDMEGVTEIGEWTVTEVTRPDADDPEAGPTEDDAARIRYYNAIGGGTGTVEADGVEWFRITNELTPKTLTIRKTLDGYDIDGQNVTIVFRITGRDASGEVIYVNHAAVNFGPGDGLTKERVITGIPYDVASIEAEEEYSGNYDKSDDITVEETADDAGNMTGWLVSASNEHNGHGPKGGVVNRYGLGKDTEQDFGTR